MRRRDFIGRLALMAGVVSGWGWKNQAQAATQKYERAGISTWSFHNYFQATREQDFSWPGEMIELRDFPEIIADRYRVHRLELCSAHFPSTEPSFLADLKARLRKAHSRVVNMPVDFREDWAGGGLDSTKETVRREQVAKRQKWMDIAATLGAQAIRPNPGHGEGPNPLEPIIRSYRELAAYGKSKKVKVLIENHGGVSGNAQSILAIVKAVNSPYLGSLPDFGNFKNADDRFPGLEQLFPYAPVVCHAKTIDFDAQGNNTTFDFGRCMKISQAAKFTGTYSIEFEGKGEPYESVKKSVDLLLKYL